ncbi:TIM-barrel domain-containing protein [Maribacter ulvicola]|uniref:Alpha-glucosidase, glycosyl hydrolase family GH31 n=1 Tax=Maribacter ulvicola TaxID=228959 RepID=A0A1N6S5B2_9FLAO|nr:TIM-barrel domain-containing protein [Maribacter ulvicola]SIQ36284.1 Alpha-glucosidase, glycosyl hydrolase family GH31 [Maribacter ulvicola]
MNYIKGIFFLSIIFLSLINLSCKTQEDKGYIYINDGINVLKINTSTFQFQFENLDKEILVPGTSSTGLLINGDAITSSSLIKSTNSENSVFKVTNSNGENAQVTITFKEGIVKFVILPETKKESDIVLRLGAMPVAHGLGDAGAFRESFNLLENKNKKYAIENNGGGQRWSSSFTIFPPNNFAGVFFDKGKKIVTLNEEEYAMHITKKGTATFYYFLGTLKTIYANYKKVREIEGYDDVKPKSRLFELGWESWDALGWNTNQKTVQEILEKFQQNNYPIRWAVTGSGFWDQGGTTTSFGKWGKKFSNPSNLKTWMHGKDIKWMIGLRTNLIPEGGPYYPATLKRDKNLVVNSFYGNELTSFAKEQGYLVTDKNGAVVDYTSSIFPIVPSNLLNGSAPGAAQWYQQQYAKWGVDGIKEDTMMDLDSLTNIFNAPITEIAKKGGLVMARNGEFSSPGTLLRINDTGVGDLHKRLPINYFQYAASGFPNVYSDVAGVHNMHNIKDVDRNIRHTWLLSLTAGLAVGAYPEKWTDNKREIFKKAIDFHYKLAPYMFNEAMEGYRSGYPQTLTPMTIAYPNDPRVAKLQNYQWMIGESILAAPLLKNYKSGKMDVYLPEGDWFDYETGEKYQGPVMLSDYQIPLEKTPCFIGGKGIIVLRDVKSSLLQAKIYPIAKQETLYTFGYPDEQSTSKIRYKKWSANDEISVIDVTLNKQIAFKKDRENGSISFIIIPNHNYKVQLN